MYFLFSDTVQYLPRSRLSRSWASHVCQSRSQVLLMVAPYSFFWGLPYSCDSHCQMLSEAKGSRFVCLGFPFLNFYTPSFDFSFFSFQKKKKSKKIRLALGIWRRSDLQSTDLPWLSVPPSQGNRLWASDPGCSGVPQLKKISTGSSFTGCSSTVSQQGLVVLHKELHHSLVFLALQRQQQSDLIDSWASVVLHIALAYCIPVHQ